MVISFALKFVLESTNSCIAYELGWRTLSAAFAHADIADGGRCKAAPDFNVYERVDTDTDADVAADSRPILTTFTRHLDDKQAEDQGRARN